jgi:hypothetical protein
MVGGASPLAAVVLGDVALLQLCAFVALLAHGGLWLVAGTTEVLPGNVVGVVATTGVGLSFPIGTRSTHPDVEDLREPPVDDGVVARERFARGWNRGIGWAFPAVATSTVAVTRTYGSVVW